MRTFLIVTLACLLSGATAVLAQQTPSGTVVDVRQVRPGEALTAAWNEYVDALRKGDRDRRAASFAAIKAVRAERNIRRMETLALALTALGIQALDKGDNAAAVEIFQAATELDPYLPDGYFGLAQTKIKQGPVQSFGAISDVLHGLLAYLPMASGRSPFWYALLPIGMVACFLTMLVFAVALWLRYGALLQHDLAETFAGSHVMAMGLYLLLLSLPIISFVGYAWLPIWWLVLLFAYMRTIEKIVSLVLLALMLLVSPLSALWHERMLIEGNPVYRAGILSIEGESDKNSIEILEGAVQRNADDKDLQFLLASLYKKAGQYDNAAAIYLALIAKDPNESVALNNMANIEFARGEFVPATTYYNDALKAATSRDLQATIHYNLSLTYAVRFKTEEYQAARNKTLELGGDLAQDYDHLWRYVRDGSVLTAVVDWNLSADQWLAKFDKQGLVAARKGLILSSARQSFGAGLAKGLGGRSTFVVVAHVLVVIALILWRGKKMFTMSCLKCGLPFCKRCHLGASIFGLCTQCHHLFIVRDGVSGPARNSKMLEVQEEEERRGWVFRILSLVSPGAGHIYGRRTLMGLLLVLIWYVVLCVGLLVGRILPVTDVSSRLMGPWHLVAIIPILIVIYVLANRARPDFEVMVPTRRTGAQSSSRSRGYRPHGA